MGSKRKEIKATDPKRNHSAVSMPVTIAKWKLALYIMFTKDIANMTAVTARIIISILVGPFKR
jgi:argininosuccinate lyase